MSINEDQLNFPDYDGFSQSTASLKLALSVSELHGMMCGYLCAGADHQGEIYLRTLLNNKKDAASQVAFLEMFNVFSVSQQQIHAFDFTFNLLLPDENASLRKRACAFSEWCEGFVQGLTVCNINADNFYDEESQDALYHLQEFAELDYTNLESDEEDEQALMEVSEYVRMAVIRLYHDLVDKKKSGGLPRH